MRSCVKLKEINYLGDFNQDIENVKKGNKSFFERWTAEDILIISYFSSLFHYLINAHNEVTSKLRFNVSYFLCQGILSILFLLFNKMDENQAIRESEEKLCQLVFDLFKELNVNIVTEDLVNCSMIKEEKTLFPIDGSIEYAHFKQDKVVRYFELLDKNEQIQVLKYIQSRLLIDDREITESVCNQLFLLEEEDYELENIPVTRKLKR